MLIRPRIAMWLHSEIQIIVLHIWIEMRARKWHKWIWKRQKQMQWRNRVDVIWRFSLHQLRIECQKRLQIHTHSHNVLWNACFLIASYVKQVVPIQFHYNYSNAVAFAPFAFLYALEASAFKRFSISNFTVHPFQIAVWPLIAYWQRCNLFPS